MARINLSLLALGLWASITHPTASQADQKAGAIPQGKNHVIQVGDPNAAKIFTPPTVDANVGDLVTFEFHPKAHTVSQSLFESPCQVANSTQGKGFNSGLIPVKAQTKSSDLPRWTMQVLVSTPIWFYCAPHCGLGMVGAINPPKSGDQTFEKFVENAKKQGAKNARSGAGKELAVSKEQAGGKEAGSKEQAGAKEKEGSKEAGGVTTGGGGDGADGPAGKLQRGQPMTANELAALNMNSAVLNGTKDSNNLATKPTTSGGIPNALEERKIWILSVSFTILLPNLFTYLLNSNPKVY